MVDARIRWAPEVVMTHALYRSCLSLDQFLFGAMFPGSEMVKNFKISKTKVSYFVVFGMAEYFYNSLMNLVKQSSLNGFDSMQS